MPAARRRSDAGAAAIDLPLQVLLGKPPRMTRRADRRRAETQALDLEAIHLREAALRLLRLPTIADKTFLISIGDRTVGGLISRDQMACLVLCFDISHRYLTLDYLRSTHQYFADPLSGK